jgi:antitoxin CptB
MNDALDTRRKKLIFRAWHRGTREADLLLGRFAEARVPGFGAMELDQFEALLTESDPDIYDWLTERQATPPAHGAVMLLLKRFSFKTE